MRNSDQLPIHTEQPRKARYYAHRIHESLTSKVCKVFCAVFLTILLIVGIVAFILWLSLRPHRPRFHVVDFSVPSLGQPNGFENAEIIFNATARNPNQNIEFSYGSLEGIVYYRDQRIGSTVLKDAFKQEPKTTTVLVGALGGATLTITSDRWAEFSYDRSLGSVLFRLDITSTFHYKVGTWESKSHRIHASCEIRLGPDGSILADYRNKRCPVYFT